MNKNYLIGATVALCLLVAFLFVSENKQGSVNVASEYRHINLLNVTGSTTSSTLLKSGPAVLGSVTVPTTTSHLIEIYDVAAAANFASTTLSTLIVSIPTSTPAGTYTFDLTAKKGLAVHADVTPTSQGVITYR